VCPANISLHMQSTGEAQYPLKSVQLKYEIAEIKIAHVSYHAHYYAR